MLKGKTVILGVTGSIAAYKIANLASALKKLRADVHVIMTKNATEFITPLTFETLTGNKCLVDTFDRDFKYDVKHVSLGEKADIMLVAPASANVIGKLAHGIADDMLTTTALSLQAPLLVAPAMNTHMYEKTVVKENLETLGRHGITVIEPASGRLACGDTGKGKMPEPEVLMEWILNTILRPKDYRAKNVLITAGPTREAFDPVRFITNHSTGKMGYALAREAIARGARVTFVCGPCGHEAPLGCMEVVNVETAAQMHDAVVSRFASQDVVIMAAAVADYRPVEVSTDKIKKSDEDATFRFEKTDDILMELGQKKRDDQFLCGFSMETTDVIENSRKKLLKKNLNLIVSNNVKVDGAGFGTDTNVVTLIDSKGELGLPIMEKSQVAKEILDRIQKMV
ncbi:MAG: bifunctional phosphopantothenoylcysteine decarboxylase/phosphopantothenate--cysteine ligase CoaBC [Eubacterium sp.]|nr:bifunctional phosphopantothenoylcysteine decarboxylase/phosphopantothenate--cysteine ligase CoaBC [Eubacterium sp.]